MNASLISVRPRFTSLILDGSKTVELRRRAPNVAPGHSFFVYECAPTMAIVGVVRVKAVERARLGPLWRRVRVASQVSRREYLEYFAGLDCGVAIHLEAAWRFDIPLTLKAVRSTSPLFHPPRTWISFGALPLPLQSELRHRLAANGGAARAEARFGR
jgi:predicted transcriptional regulator